MTLCSRCWARWRKLIRPIRISICRGSAWILPCKDAGLGINCCSRAWLWLTRVTCPRISRPHTRAPSRFMSAWVSRSPRRLRPGAAPDYVHAEASTMTRPGTAAATDCTPGRASLAGNTFAAGKFKIPGQQGLPAAAVTHCHLLSRIIEFAPGAVPAAGKTLGAVPCTWQATTKGERSFLRRAANTPST
jgi:hypothetical protein